MDEPQEVIEVLFEDGWKIAFRGYRFGPYPSRRDAVAIAATWAESTRRQGHNVVLRFPWSDGDTLARPRKPDSLAVEAR
jgi:hypothetical protein